MPYCRSIGLFSRWQAAILIRLNRIWAKRWGLFPAGFGLQTLLFHLQTLSVWRSCPPKDFYKPPLYFWFRQELCLSWFCLYQLILFDPHIGRSTFPYFFCRLPFPSFFLPSQPCLPSSRSDLTLFLFGNYPSRLYWKKNRKKLLRKESLPRHWPIRLHLWPGRTPPKNFFSRLCLCPSGLFEDLIFLYSAWPIGFDFE